MSDTKHTPGPWTYEGNGRIDGATSDGIGVQTVASAVHERDAQLIAAAPELLEACKEAARFIALFTDESEHREILEILRRLDDLTAKAEGR